MKCFTDDFREMHEACFLIPFSDFYLYIHLFFYFSPLRFHFCEPTVIFYWYSTSPILQTHVEALTFILLSIGFFIQLSKCRRNTRSLNQDSSGIICKYTNPFCFSLDQNFLWIFCVLAVDIYTWNAFKIHTSSE